MTEILITDFVLVFLIFVRIISVMVTAPIFGNISVPAMVKVSLSIIISYIIFLTIDKSNIHVDLNLISLALNAGKEVITGATMGFMLNFVFQGISFASSIIGYDMGLMMAEVMNPFEDSNSNVIGELIFFGAVMIFIFINGHHYIITAAVASFQVIPIGKFSITDASVSLLIKYAFSVFTIAIKIASPILVSFFLVHLAEGVVSKVIPNIQVFFVSQPLKLGLGFFMLSVLVPMYVYVIKGLLQNYENELFELIRTMGT